MSDMTEAARAIEYHDDRDGGYATMARPTSPFDEAFAEAQAAEAELGSVIAQLTDRLADYLRPEPEPGEKVPSLAEADSRALVVTRIDHHAAAIRSQTDRLRRLLRLLDV